MEIIIPVPYTVIDGAPEPGAGEVVWNAAVNYAVGTLAYLESTHRIYKNLVAGVNATTPDVEAAKPGSDTTRRWKEWAPTNRYAMFDRLVGSYTQAPSPFVSVIQLAEFADSLWLDVDACDTVRVEVLDGAVVVFDTTENMLDVDDVVDWYEYFFSPTRSRRQVTLTNLPPVTNAKIRMTFTGSSGTVRVGSCVPGRMRVIGDTELNPSIGVITYSTTDLDQETGITRINSGPLSRRINFSAVCPTGVVDEVVRTLMSLEDTPIVWKVWPGSGQRIETMTLYGFAKDWEIAVRFERKSFLTARLEQLA